MIDMHIHSTFSDGELEPIELLELCRKNNVTTFSITDHDNISGVKEAIHNNPYSDITIIPGIELGAKYKNGQLHILGYNMDLDNKALISVIKAIDEDNIRRIKSLVYLIKKHYNVSFKEYDLEKVFTSPGTVCRPDIGKLCVKYGYTSTVKQAFELFFEPVKERVEKKKIEVTDYECIKYITNAGGIACVAHPNTLRKNPIELEEYFKTLISYGISAAEVYHSSHSYEFTNQLVYITDKLHMLQSGGSDYHGPIIKPNTKIGTGINGNLNINTLSILNTLLNN